MPPRFAESCVPERVHVPAVTDHVTLPDDCPPEAVRVRGEPVVKDELLVMLSPLCDAFAVLTEVSADDRTA
jgi:hypothetical protein